MLRARWVTVCVTTLVALLGAIAISLLTPPLYEASTRFFVSTVAGSTLTETALGNRYSKERVKSYAELLTGETLAQRTIDKLGLEISAEKLQKKIKARAQPDTVLIEVDVVDGSPVRARDIANTLSDEFVAMVRELETPEGGSIPDSRVVVEQRATLPSVPVAPKPKRNIAIGLAAGLLLGIGLALLRDLLDNTIKDRQNLEEVANVGVVGTIPNDKSRRSQPAMNFETDNSTVAESFRKLRTNLQFLAVDNPPRVIVFSSSVPSEGKSTTAINVALALAEAEHNVVLVDGDLRRPTLAKYLDLVGQVGFSTVLSGSASLAEALQKTRFPRLTVLTSGALPPNPSELLASQSARNLLSELRAEFDYVIVDSAPLLAVTDAAVLTAAADGVLIMARFGHTKCEQLIHAVNSLERVGGQLLGAVFTMVPTRRRSPYSYGNYSYGSARHTPGSQGPDVRAAADPADSS